MKQEKMFENIVGYEDIKKTLTRIIDVLNNYDKYNKLGVKLPNGLFIYGPPGTGKTTISKDFIKYVNRKSYIVRKLQSDDDLANIISSKDEIKNVSINVSRTTIRNNNRIGFSIYNKKEVDPEDTKIVNIV